MKPEHYFEKVIKKEALMRSDADLTKTVDEVTNSILCIEMSGRRGFLIKGAQAAAALALLAPGAAILSASSAVALNKTFKDAMQDILKGATPTTELMALKMPNIAENGNVVSIKIDATAAEAEGKSITALHVFATDNPWPYVASFELSKLSGKAIVTSRMRLARSQKVIVLGAVDDGSYLLAETFVKVTIGGCGG